MADNYSVPILFLIFNRPDTTAVTFDAIKQAKPQKLYIAADGPRPGKSGEEELCSLTRKVIEQVDWECEIKTLFRDNNLGCKNAVSSAITWFFENEEMGIILEDDCLPSNSFFSFCKELLIKYKDDDRVWHIDGTTSQEGVEGTSYQFSKYCLIWGWATWRRAWSKYDKEIKSFPEFKERGTINTIWQKPEVRKTWLNNMESVYNGLVDTWDYQWAYCVWINNGLSIRPNVNLIKNIGFDKDATHTHTANSLLKSLKNNEIVFPLKHPTFFVPNVKMDDRCSAEHFDIYPPATALLKRIKKKFKSLVS